MNSYTWIISIVAPWGEKKNKNPAWRVVVILLCYLVHGQHYELLVSNFHYLPGGILINFLLYCRHITLVYWAWLMAEKLKEALYIFWKDRAIWTWKALVTVRKGRTDRRSHFAYICGGFVDLICCNLQCPSTLFCCHRHRYNL